MKRAFLLEMTIFRDYARQLVGLGLRSSATTHGSSWAWGFS